jgi:hypothetical protein
VFILLIRARQVNNNKKGLEQVPQWTPMLHGVNAHVRDAFERV